MKALEAILLSCFFIMFFIDFILFASNVRTDIAVPLSLVTAIFFMILVWRFPRIWEWVKLFSERYGPE